MSFQFRPLYDFPGLTEGDPLLQRIVAAIDAAGLDHDAMNASINAIMSRALQHVRETGAHMTRDAFMQMVGEHAQQAGLDLKTVQGIAQQFVGAGVSAGDPSAAGYNAERLAGIESDLLALEDSGKLSRAELDALANYGQTVAGVQYIEKLTAYAKGEGPAPAMPADLAAFYPPGVLDTAPGDSSTDDNHTEAKPMTDDKHYPRVTDGPRHTETPEQAQARREHEDLRAKQNGVYSLMRDPRYSAPGSEGEVFRAEVARKFEDVFGGEDSAGRSEAGLGV